MRRILAGLTTVGVVVVLLVIAQLVLPEIAATHIRDQLSKSGKVIEVDVSAFPAIELLWHQADTVTVRMANYHSTTGGVSSLLDESSDAGTLNASAQVLTDGLLTLRNATLEKRGNTLTGTAEVKESDLRTAVPLLQSVTPIASSGGQLVLQGTALGFSVDATVQAQAGKLLVTPNLPFGVGGLATLTVFSDPHVAVDSISATRAPGGFAVSTHGHLH